MKDMFREEIKEREAELGDEETPKDFIDVYLQEIVKEKQRKGHMYSRKTSNFHMEQLVSTCLDFFLAGSETTGTTLTWAIMHMALNPEIQRKCQAEIDEVIKGTPKNCQ